MNAKHAVYPGTFDPVTNGHLDILERALGLFDSVTLAVARGGRATLLDHDVRMNVAREAVLRVTGGARCRVVGFDGLLVETVQKLDADVVVRGIRGPADLEHEQPMAALNRSLYHDFEVVLLFARPELSMISATLVRDVARCGGPVDGYVPPEAAAALAERYADRH